MANSRPRIQRLSPLTTRRNAGFSLVEILISVVIGLIGILMMTQMTANWETRKRSSTSAGDAQISGSIALYRLEQDIRQAGFGFGTSANVGCTVTAYDSNRTTPAFNFPMVPLAINDGAGGAPDTITVLYGDSSTMSGDLSFTSSTSTSKRTKTRNGISKGELLIAVQNAVTCGLIEITDNTDADNLTINHNSGNYVDAQGVAATARYNAAGGLGIAFTNGTLYNMGLAPRNNVWQINIDALESRNELNLTGDGDDDWVQVADGIINLQAVYGLDTNNDTIIDTWQATAPGAWSTVRAVRIALLARGQQYEKAAVYRYPDGSLPNDCTAATVPPCTPAAPAWAGGDFVMTNLDGTADSNPGDANDWRHYRYRVYETVIPLRNMVWGTAP
ncbi:MAG: PilW family protein [Georgfuchsia sp.]